MPLFIFPHPQCPYHMHAHAPVSQLVSSCQFPMFYARQCEATRRVWWREPTTRVFNGSGHVTVLQEILQTPLIVAKIFKIYCFRWGLQALWEPWVRSPQTTVVSLNEWLPLHSPSPHCFHFWRRNLSFLEPEPDADRVCLEPHTLFSLFNQWEVFSNQWEGFISSSLHQGILDVWHVQYVAPLSTQMTRKWQKLLWCCRSWITISCGWDATRLLVFSFKLHLIDPWFWPKAGNIGLLFVCPLVNSTSIHLII